MFVARTGDSETTDLQELQHVEIIVMGFREAQFDSAELQCGPDVLAFVPGSPLDF